MPRCRPRDGDATGRGDDIDVLVESDDRIVDMPEPEPSDIERAVATHVVALIPDRATVQLGVGTLPAAVCRIICFITCCRWYRTNSEIESWYFYKLYYWLDRLVISINYGPYRSTGRFTIRFDLFQLSYSSCKR